MKYLFIPLWKVIQLILWCLKIVLMYTVLCLCATLVTIWTFKFPTREQNSEFWDDYEWGWVITNTGKFNIQDIKYYKSPKDLWNRKATIIKDKD